MIVRTRRQRRALAEMQRSLSRSDPRLVARFSLFTRLTMDEAIPPFERVSGWAARRPVMVIRRRWSRAAGGPARWTVAGMLLIPLLMVMLTLLVTLGGHPGPECGPLRVVPGLSLHTRFPAARWSGPVPGCRARPAPASSPGSPGR